MENHSLTINISKNISNQCFRSRASARTDVLKLSLIIMRCHIELKAIRNRWQLGNAGKRWQSWGISNRETLGIRNWQSGESSGNPAIQGIPRQSWEFTGNLAMRGIIGNQAMEGIRQLGNAGI